MAEVLDVAETPTGVWLTIRAKPGEVVHAEEGGTVGLEIEPAWLCPVCRHDVEEHTRDEAVACLRAIADGDDDAA